MSTVRLRQKNLPEFCILGLDFWRQRRYNIKNIPERSFQKLSDGSKIWYRDKYDRVLDVLKS